MLDVSTISLYHVFKATPPFTDTSVKKRLRQLLLLLFNIRQMAPLNKMNY